MRPRWTPLTSRRFCEFCEIEQKQHDLLPRAVAIIVLLIGVAGVTAYFRATGNGSDGDISSRPRSASRREFAENTGRDPHEGAHQSNSVNRTPGAVNIGPGTNVKQRETLQNSSTEPVYYCGAITKKGTPCTRRVKTKTRCWQHRGQPADR